MYLGELLMQVLSHQGQKVVQLVVILQIYNIFFMAVFSFGIESVSANGGTLADV